MPYKVQNTIIRRFLNSSLRTKFLLTFLIIVIVPIVLFAVFSERLISKKIHEEIQKETDQNLETVWLQYYVRADQMKYGMLQATESVERGILNHDHIFLRNKMRLWKNTRPYVDIWIVVNREHKVIARLNSDRTGDFFDLNGIVEKALISQSPVISTEVMPEGLLLLEGENLARDIAVPVRMDESDKYDPGRKIVNDALMLTVVVPVMDDHNVVGAIITGDILNKDNFIPNTILSKIPDSMVAIARDGVRIATTATDVSDGKAIGTLLSAPVMSYLNRGESYRGDALVEGNNYITAFDPIKDSKGNTIGSLFIGVPESRFTDLHRENLHIILLALAAGVLFAGGSAILASTFLVRPLNTLVQKATEIGSGNLDTEMPFQIDGTTDDEVSILARSFNYMMTGLKERSSEREIHFSELQKKTVEISAVNEKLQATNQELEVSLEEAQSQQEELQSANEELIILNEELEKKTNDLFDANMKIMQDEEKLKLAKDKLQLIYDGINDYIFLLEPDCTIVEVNKAFLEKYGYKEHEVIGKKCYEMVYGCNDIVNECRGAHIETPYRHRTSTKDNRIVDRYVFPIHDSRGYLINRIEYIRDITEETILREQLAQAEKLSSLGEILSGIAHELNNPLTGVLGYCELLQETSNDKGIKEQLDKINNAAVRCKKIIENLLSFARQHKIEKEQCDINEIIKRTLELKAYQLRIDNIEVFTDLYPRLPLTMADPYSIQQVFLNLINNAHLAMLEKKKQGILSIKSEHVNGIIRIIISDTGVGISDENLSKIFNPFFSTREVGTGTGLGLSISYGIIKEHSGKIYAKSKPDAGTSFFIELPIVSQQGVNTFPSAEITGNNNEHVLLQIKKKSILVVEDEATIAEIIKTTLDGVGLDADTAENALTAIDKLQHKDYDLIISDMRMPNMDGKGLFRVVQNIKPELLNRIIFITGDLVNPDTRKFFDEYKCKYLAKPFTPTDIKKLVSDFFASDYEGGGVA